MRVLLFIGLLLPSLIRTRLKTPSGSPMWAGGVLVLKLSSAAAQGTEEQEEGSEGNRWDSGQVLQ